jgi:hypothetical protein
MSLVSRKVSFARSMPCRINAVLDFERGLPGELQAGLAEARKYAKRLIRREKSYAVKSGRARLSPTFPGSPARLWRTNFVQPVGLMHRG